MLIGKVEARGQLELSVQEVNAKFAVLEATEKNAVTTAMVEERSRFCTLVNCLKPVMVSEFIECIPPGFLIGCFT